MKRHIKTFVATSLDMCEDSANEWAEKFSEKIISANLNISQGIYELYILTVVYEKS